MACICVFIAQNILPVARLYLKFRGFCMVHWKTTQTRSVNGKNVTVTKNHESYEKYVNTKLYVAGGATGEHELQAGHHDYPFTFQIPANCPSSFQGEYGLVRYEVHAVVDRAYNVDKEKKVVVRVVAPLDLNMIPYCKEPLVMEFNNTYCCCYFTSGSTEIVIKAPKSGYCPGQKIPIEIACSNKGTVKVNHIKIRIVKNILFRATSHSDTRTNRDVLAEIKHSSVPGDTTRAWAVDLEVPAISVHNMSGCRYIDVDYKLEVIVSPGSCHSDTEDKRKIIIGTIPLVGFQDNVPNPLQYQMPQQTAAVTQQPMSSHSITSSPYPGGSGYQNNLPHSFIPPHFNTNAPYPIKYSFKSPYGADNTPYPSSNSPYPTGPGTTNLPYPVNPPYPPGSNTENPPPYPRENYLYPDNPPPYPGISSPYHPAHQSTLNEMVFMPGIVTNAFDGRFLNTGNIGFPMQVSNVPTSPASVNPYMAASAPNIESPDTEKS